MNGCWWFCIFVLYMIVHMVKPAWSEDSCTQPFSNFLQCMATDADKQLGRYTKELSPPVKQAVQACFVQNGCEKPDFSQATLSYFLKDPWLTRISDLLDVMENTDPNVKECMLQYLLESISTKINQCIQENSGDNVKNFTMPPIPIMHNMDITKFKEIVLNRMLTRVYIQKCNQQKGESVSGNVTDCIDKARDQYDQSICKMRLKCRDQEFTNETCQAQYTEIHSAICQCHNSKTYAALNMRNMLLSGRTEQEFRKCHEKFNVSYPEEKVEKARTALAGMLADILVNGGNLPKEIRETLEMAKQASKNIEIQWKGGFCSQCSDTTKDGNTKNYNETEFLTIRSSRRPEILRDNDS